MNYFKYMYDLLVERGAGHIKIFGGGGGVILPYEIEELQAYGLLVFTQMMDGFHGITRNDKRFGGTVILGDRSDR
jgi:methylmalonyl-CoA mutase cobalamin-binding subunit